MSTLKGLNPNVARLIDPNFRNGSQPTVEVDGYLEEINFGRSIDLQPLRAVIEEAMRRPDRAEKTDPWLGPRVHATLRLTRREAADKRIWYYLTVAEHPEYVRWRFRDDDNPEVPVPLDRFLGEDSKNALARLWWAAELTRTGSDYSRTVKALSNSRFAVSWLHLDVLHHRPAALAVVDVLDGFDGKGTTDYQGQVLAKAFNVYLRTLSLDALWPNPPTDAEALREWITQPIDETKMMTALPVGPDEAPVSAEAVAAVRSVLDQLTAEIGLADRKSTRRRFKPEEAGELVTAVAD